MVFPIAANRPRAPGSLTTFTPVRTSQAGVGVLLAPRVRVRSSVDLGLLVLRVFAGVALAFAHGINKLPPTPRFLAGVAEMGFPAPELFGWAAGLSEFCGGLLLALGLLTRPAALFIVITMSVASFIKQAGDPFTEREAAMLYGCAALLYLIAGPGRLSLDAMIRARRARPA
jgi:putative oxidoreductase